MMEVMEVPPQPSPSPTTPGVIDEFLQTGRTGRRNALTEDEKVAVDSTTGVQHSLEKLSCSDPSDEPSTSGQQKVNVGESSTKETTNTQSETQSGQQPTNGQNSSTVET